jgi:hypothetical protein
MSSLKDFAEMLDQRPPSEVDEKDLLTLEQFLNSLYLEERRQKLPSDIEEAILDALVLASALSSKIKRMPDQPRDAEYYRTIKKLARHLGLIDYYLDDLSRR